MFALLALLTSQARPPAIATLALRLERPDHLLPAPAAPSVRFDLDAGRAPPSCRLMFTTPRPAGVHRYEIHIAHGRADHKLIIATPLRPGRSTVEVTVTGQGRVDLGFWSSGPAPKEYRFSLQAPVDRRRLELDLPAAGAH